MSSAARPTPAFESVMPRISVSDIEQGLAAYMAHLGFALGRKWRTATALRDLIAPGDLK